MRRLQLTRDRFMVRNITLDPFLTSFLFQGPVNLGCKNIFSVMFCSFGHFLNQVLYY